MAGTEHDTVSSECRARSHTQYALGAVTFTILRVIPACGFLGCQLAQICPGTNRALSTDHASSFHSNGLAHPSSMYGCSLPDTAWYGTSSTINCLTFLAADDAVITEHKRTGWTLVLRALSKTGRATGQRSETSPASSRTGFASQEKTPGDSSFDEPKSQILACSASLTDVRRL